MRIAILAGLHANLPALEAVLADLAERSYDVLWCLGDWCSGGPHPDAVIERLRPLCTVGVIGAGDQAILQCAENSNAIEDALSPLCWTYHQLSKESRRFLRLLSASVRFTLGKQRFLLAQGAGVGDEGVPPAEAPNEDWLRFFQQAQADVIVVHHTARAFVRQIGAAWCINVPAVGYPHDGRAEAAYAWLELEEETLQVEFRRVPYAIEEVWQACRDQGIPLFPPRTVDRAADPTPEPGINHAPPEELLLDRRLAPVLALARARSENDEAYRLTVSRLALQLFDQLQGLHHQGREERFWLECAALLHTLERKRHPRRYPRRALQTILKTPHLPFETRERLLIGSLVRYQKRRPRKKHQNYALLNPDERNSVQILSALLRLAIVLAKAETPVQDLYAEVSPRKLKLQLITTAPAEALCRRARRRGRRLARRFGRKLRVSYLVETPPSEESPDG